MNRFLNFGLIAACLLLTSCTSPPRSSPVLTSHDNFPCFVTATCPSEVAHGQPIPFTITIYNNFPHQISLSSFGLTETDWNSELSSIVLTDVFRDGAESTLHPTRPPINPPFMIAGTSGYRIDPGSSLSYKVNLAKWQIEEGWRPGNYRISLRVAGLQFTDAVSASVYAAPFDFKIMTPTPQASSPQP